MRSLSRVLTVAVHLLIARTCALICRPTQTLRNTSAGVAQRPSPESPFCPNMRRLAVARHPNGQALPFYHHPITQEALISLRPLSLCWYLYMKEHWESALYSFILMTLWLQDLYISVRVKWLAWTEKTLFEFILFQIYDKSVVLVLGLPFRIFV